MPFRSDEERSPDFPYLREKKTPEVFPPSGVSPLDYSTHSPSSRRASVRSGDPTVLVVRVDQVRMPAGNNKGGRECRQRQGDERVENAGGYQRHHPLQAVSGVVGAVYELPKRGAVPPAPSSTHRPLSEGDRSKVTEETPTGRRHYDQTIT